MKIDHVTKKYQNVIAVDDVTLDIQSGEIFGVIGYSGAGKSTLLRCLNLLERPTSGDIWIDGKNFTKLSDRDVRTERQKVGMIFQHFHLISAKTVFDNISFSLKAYVNNKQVIQKVLPELLIMIR